MKKNLEALFYVVVAVSVIGLIGYNVVKSIISTFQLLFHFGPVIGIAIVLFFAFAGVKFALDAKKSKAASVGDQTSSTK